MLVESTDLGGGVRLLAMNRPPANAINADLGAAFYERCSEAREDKALRALIVTGTGKFFSAGLDLKEVVADPGRVANLGGSDDEWVRALWTMPKPTVAMINGHAIAGGLVIALACDLRITHPGAHKIGLNEVAFGSPFPAVAFEIVRLALTPRGQRHALLEAALSGPQRALELGFVDELVDNARLEARSVEIARRLAGLGQLAYAHTKRAMQREALARLAAETAEQRGDLMAILTSEETRALLGAHLRSVSKK
jgi:enoyl-CoA hydratase